jgi:hypothetical protein
MEAPRPVLRRLNAGKPSRSPEGTAMPAALSREHIARGPAWERPGARPAVSYDVGGGNALNH